MKRIIFFIGLMLSTTIHTIAQELLIQSTESVKTDSIRTTIRVRAGSSPKKVQIMLSMANTDQNCVVNINPLPTSTFSGHTFLNNPFPGVMISPNGANLEVVDVQLPADNGFSSIRHIDLLFSWNSMTHYGRVLTKRVRISVIPKSFTKMRDLGDNEWVNTANTFRDSTNTNKYEFIQFTDFVGFDNDRPNGRIQQQLMFKWGVAKTWKGKKFGWQHQWVRSFIFPDILFNRIDKTQTEVNYSYPGNIPVGILPNGQVPGFTSMDIWKYSNLQIGGKLVLLALKKGNFNVYVEPYARLIRNRPFFDTLKVEGSINDSSFVTMYSGAYGIDLYGKTDFKAIGKMQLDWTFGLMWIRLFHSNFRQINGPEIEQFQNVETKIPVNLRQKNTPIWFGNFRLKKPLTEKDNNYIYLRGSYLLQTGKYQPLSIETDTNGGPLFNLSNEKRKFYNHFFQLQLGVSIDLNSLFKKE